MNPERSLFDRDGSTIQERFDRFIAANPEVWNTYVKLARQAKAAGRRRYSSDALIQVLRWHMNVVQKREDEFAINDNFSSRFARKLLREHPDEFKDFFELRKLHAA